MAEKRRFHLDFNTWASATDATVEEVEKAWADLQRRGLAEVKQGKVILSPLALRRATNHVQRRLTVHLSGYLFTENSFIVRLPGDPPSHPYVLNTRIAVEHIANYFREGWGLTDIQKDLSILTREEIEAAIQYYRNHREEIDNVIQRSRDVYETHSAHRELVAA